MSFHEENTILIREAIDQAYVMDETEALKNLYQYVDLSSAQRLEIMTYARSIAEKARENAQKESSMKDLIHQYSLSSEEGIALMCVAEALLRIPDKETAIRLIKDKVGSADWQKYMGDHRNIFLNASTWALSLTGKVLGRSDEEKTGLSSVLSNLVSRSGAPIIRQAMEFTMKLMGKNFVHAETIEKALKKAKDLEKIGYTYSFDMLGEGARTFDDADRYFETYKRAIRHIGHMAKGESLIHKKPGISVKLSALHPRYEVLKGKEALKELSERLLQLTLLAKEHQISICVDAEESYRLDISLDLIEEVFLHPDLAGYEGFGLAVQAYQKRAFYLIDWLEALAKRGGRKIFIRLVKGAYWDTEIKYAQVKGLPDYPVFTRKTATDLSYFACAKKLLKLREWIYPQFATHNAHTVSGILSMAGANRTGFEFQKLHGMGSEIYDQIVGQYPCRIYAPVGNHVDLLPYLVRRLLENGANSSFVNQLQNKEINMERLVFDPIRDQELHHFTRHAKIPLPKDIFGSSRQNSAGLLLDDRNHLRYFLEEVSSFSKQDYRGFYLIKGKRVEGREISVFAPHNHGKRLGSVIMAGEEDAKRALDNAAEAFPKWRATSVESRAAIVERMADLLETNRAEITALLIEEAGKTILDAHDEIREAVDFCRYYAAEARNSFAAPKILPGPTGEENKFWYEGKGIFVCISPWNFPAAIFLGQISAALVTGNTVIAKPAEPTCLLASYLVQLYYQAGLERDVLQLIPGKGSEIGPILLQDRRVVGVAFTGSTETARRINMTLAERRGPIATLIAETGGQNVMFVDSSALCEQVVDDVVNSAFRSAGQRCSALRILLIQEDVADKMIHMLQGAAMALKVGNPLDPSTDVGPVINQAAKEELEKHIRVLKQKARHLFSTPLDELCEKGTFIAPQAYEVQDFALLKEEHFGPVLHIRRYKPENLDDLIQEVNELGFGLTYGVHSRINQTVRKIEKEIEAGNCYINRNMIGAVVGVQPFGGQKLSGTGPKAGGPNYLHRFVTEKVSSNNIAAMGGNTTLVMLQDE